MRHNEAKFNETEINTKNEVKVYNMIKARDFNGSPAFKSPERKNIFNINSKSKATIGSHNPKYKLIFASNPQWQISRMPRISFFDEIAARSLSNAPKSFVYDCQQHANPKGSLKFSRQQKRKDSLFQITEPHDSRFELFDANPEVLSSCKRLHIANWSKMGGRKEPLFNIVASGVEYEPKYEAIKKRNGGVVSFSKMNGRGRHVFPCVGDAKGWLKAGKLTRYYEKVKCEFSAAQVKKLYLPLLKQNEKLAKYLRVIDEPAKNVKVRIQRNNYNQGLRRNYSLNFL
eukprot:TRINITY_DN17169_c0_g1_i1.p1 TRINITY_DN17169_c0_g1~~TRINITY_DN17169_c0_g1_i1.p1  ORF type:complete len:286 (+),score=37.33 TRINITY_DN17169_c0_g1_i1:128-985(+)